ncbi:MAG: zinc ribbon domain-containing protein [Chloroflexi bacterium]|nr:zinc ribbon domain-containing protein [Chloroflexota bacterium]
MKCPQCGTEAEPEARFCGECGADLGRKFCPHCKTEADSRMRFCPECGKRLDEPLAADGGQAGPRTEAPASGPGAPGGPSKEPMNGQQAREKEVQEPERQKKGRGCIGWGCLIFTLLLVLLLLVAGAGAAIFFRVPERIGLVKSPAERLFSGTPDRQAARELKDELARAGVDTKGLDIYVLPVTGKDSSVAIAVMDSSRGFRFGSTRGRDPVIDFMGRLSTSKTAEAAGIKRVAIDYRNEKGESLLALTASVDAASGFARGGVSREEFMQNLEGKANWQAVTEEALKWLQQ